MANHYFVGARPCCWATFTDADGTAQDPTAVYFKVTDPSGNTTTYTYGVDAQLVQSATGIYYVAVDADEAGIWWYRYYSTGTGQAAGEAFFRVEPSKF
jgi:hypothetical protein